MTKLLAIAMLVVAVLGAAGSVYLSVGLGLKACPLCFYQRSFVIAAALVLALSLWLDALGSARACVVALPLASAGLGVAIFHEYLVAIGKLECPPALLGWGDGPIQSLSVFTVLTAGCFVGTWSARRAEGRGALLIILAAVLLGLGAAWACIASAPPLPPSPTQPYDPVRQPFDMCRPPFHAH
jgi:disulfide bond formation protein DsbB